MNRRPQISGWWAALWLVLFVFLGLPRGAAEEAGDETLRIATYNLDNYLVMDRLVNGRWRPDYPKPEHEKAFLRENIRAVDPDILLVQEIGDLEFLEELRSDLAQEGLHYSYAVHMRGEDEERHLALLSRYLPVDVVKHPDLDFKYLDGRMRLKRGLLEASFGLPDGRAFRLFGVHLKSRWTDDKRDPESAMRRTREAEACRDRIIERTLDAGEPLYLVAGDFNDHPDSPTLRRFYQRGDRELGSLVPIADSRGHVWTYFYQKHGVYSRIDGFVASPELAPMIQAGRGHILDGPVELLGSDHRLVYLDLTL